MAQLPDVAIVTISRFMDLFQQLHDSIEKHEPAWRHRIVVRDIDPQGDKYPVLGKHDGWSVLPGALPFNYARNWNIGIKATPSDCDVLLVNDDVAFVQPNGIASLRRIAHEHPDVGILSPLFDGEAGNPLQCLPKVYGEDLWFSEERLAFSCIYIKRRTLDAVGLLDEKFGEYGGDDVDYCLRVQKVGLKLGITSGVTIKHGFGDRKSGASAHRMSTDSDLNEQIGRMNRLLEKKHNRDPLWDGSSLSFETPLGNRVLLSFVDGARVEPRGEAKATYSVKFINDETGECYYGTEIGQWNWAAPHAKYFVPWRVLVDEKGICVMDHRLSLEGKSVLVFLSSKSLGDTVAWIPYVEEFQKAHNCKVHVRTFWRGILEKAYPDLDFHDVDELVPEVYASYTIGCFDDDYNKCKNNWRVIPVQQIASDCLGLPWGNIRPRIVQSDDPRPIKDRYVVISEFSTFHAKQWLYPNGWQTVVDWLTSRGYRVASISKEPTGLRNVLAWNNRSIEETINNIKHAELFVGVSNGPMWLAYALSVPSVIISGFTLPYSEMSDCYRVINQKVCTGCYNDISHPFVRGHWFYCPRKKNFECSISITPEAVKDAICKAIGGPTPIRPVDLPESMRSYLRQNQEEGILYIAPHLSTGGLPQYLLWSIERALKRGVSVEVVEWTCLSPDYTVQRKKIQSLCRVHSLMNSKDGHLWEILHNFRPSMVHLQEFAESFLPDHVSGVLFKSERYVIVETTHDSRFNPKDKRWFPKRIEVVSRFHQGHFASLGVPIDYVPYTVEPKPRPARDYALLNMGLEPRQKHILNVGLFTPGKNQGEVFAIARQMPDVMFYFLGNQAPNFAEYWKPLMATRPANCIILGERGDVDKFYSAMDALLFTSTSELAPLVVKEALAWNMPVYMRNLPIYMGEYDNEPLVTFIDDDVQATVEKLKNGACAAV